MESRGFDKAANVASGDGLDGLEEGPETHWCYGIKWPFIQLFLRADFEVEAAGNGCALQWLDEKCQDLAEVVRK
jgi:hypothetical protein